MDDLANFVYDAEMQSGVWLLTFARWGSILHIRVSKSVTYLLCGAFSQFFNVRVFFLWCVIFKVLSLTFANGESMRYWTEAAPADSPNMVTCPGSPPKYSILFCTHFNANTWSWLGKKILLNFDYVMWIKNLFVLLSKINFIHRLCLDSWYAMFVLLYYTSCDILVAVFM